MKSRLPFTAALLVSTAGAFGLGWALRPIPSLEDQLAEGQSTNADSASSLAPAQRTKSERHVDDHILRRGRGLLRIRINIIFQSGGPCWYSV